jgi:predicted RNase H-like HicB family nuclease
MKHAPTIDLPKGLRTYRFRVVIEPDEDAWHAHCPALAAHGAATWGETREEALRHIREVVEMTVSELLEDGDAIPSDAPVSEEPLVSVTV